LTFDLEQRTEPFRRIAAEIEAIAIDLLGSPKDLDPRSRASVRLQALSRSLHNLCIDLAAGMAADISRQIGVRDALASSERHFRTLAENLPNYLSRHTTNAEMLYMNPVLAAFVGREASELVGNTPMQVYSDGQFDEIQRAILETASTGKGQKTDLSFVDEDGQRTIHEVHFVAELDEMHAVTSVLGIGYDVTGRKKSELALKKALGFAEGVIAALPDLLFEMDREGRYLNVWAKNSDMLTRPKDELIGRTVWDVLPTAQASVAIQAIEAADREGVAYSSMIPIDMPDGRRWFEHSLAKKPGETPEGDTFLVLSHDVTERRQVEQALDATRARLLSVLQAIPDMIWLKDTSGAYLSCNHAFERMLGKSESVILGKTDYDLFNVEMAADLRRQDNTVIETREAHISETWFGSLESGDRILLEKHRVPVFDVDRNVIGVLGIARDITERRTFEEKLASREREFRTLVEHSPDMIARYDKDFRCVYANPMFAGLVPGGASALLGRKPSEFPGGTGTALYERELREAFANSSLREFELIWIGQDSKSCVSLIKLTPELDRSGAVVTVLAVGRDITELHASRDKIQRMAYYDTLTALPNRMAFNERLRETIVGVSAQSRVASVMMIDMDRFKGINDTMGHAIGDELLREVATRLCKCVRTEDTVARFGGDEFVILLPGVCDRRLLEDISRAIMKKFDDRFVLNGKDVFVSCSIGIAQYPTDCVEADDLMRYADSAMYLAKRSGRNRFCFYSKELTLNAVRRLALESDLHHAIERGELELHYQPKVSISSKEVMGAEALLRWRRPGYGYMTPDQFVPIAEETGLIVQLGEWVLCEACLLATEWNTSRKAVHKVAVNLSPRQFQFSDFASKVNDILIATGCRPEWLEFEITESLLLAEDDSILDTLSLFRKMGVSIAIDDFGTGFSSLSYLTRFSIDTLKIDRSFVQKVSTDRRHAELVKVMLSIAECLGQEVVAEGVETMEQANFLEENGCRFAQGFFYSHPLPKRNLATLPRHLTVQACTKPSAAIGHADQ
jgi:diguanylate cyclase (GGDEF)-like protein/PAS domain S-box-containing protein